MAQLNHTQTYGSNVTPTIEQLFREGDASTHSTLGLGKDHSSMGLGKDHDHEEDIDHHQKKSVFFKVKEKAKKLRHTLSNKKKHEEDENTTTPSWGYNLDEDEDEDEDSSDAEYLGAPMYESKHAPEDCKENARQHPRANPVIAENHILANTIKLPSQRHEKALNASTMLPHMLVGSSLANVKTTTETAAANTNSTMNKIHEKEAVVKTSSPSKTLTETVTEKLTPIYSTVTDATHALASRIQNLAVSAPSDPSAYSSPATPRKASSPTTQKAHSSPTTPQTSRLGKGAEQIWDKGVSVKEYLLHKFEPGEDERALSQVLSDALSPRKMSGDVGMVEKVREAVNSMLLAEEAPQPKATHLAPTKLEATPQPMPAHLAAKSSSQAENSQKPVAANSSLRAEATPQPKAAHFPAKPSLQTEKAPQPMATQLTAKPSSQAKAAQQTTLATHLAAKPSLPVETTSDQMVAHLAGKSSSSAPIFTTTHTVAEEENLERILQAN